MSADSQDDSMEDTSEAMVKTARCPNCGRRFVGDYCPSCGQEADPSVSATGVVGGFLRELIDVENGVWPTFIGLTLRPGKTLQQYLGGVRKGLATPGRYLLAAVVVTVGTRQISRWVGALPPPVTSPYMLTADGKRDALGASGAYFNSAAEQAPILLFLLVAIPLTLSLWTVFRDQFSGGAEALAVGSFLTGHTLLLEGGVSFALTWAGYLSGFSSIEMPELFTVAFVIGYVGIACWRCFGPGWKPALKGMLSGTWAWVEFFAVMTIAAMITGFWLWNAYPSTYYLLEPGETQSPRWIPLTVFWAIAIVSSVPLLLHAGLEAYYRLR